MIGNIGFQGDDWWQFSWPYWHSFPNSIWEYAKASRRPVEGLYTVLAFETFGLHRVFYTLSALSLSAAGCLLMGACLKRAFPLREPLVVMSVAFAFLIPSTSNLIYMFHTDNSRLSVLFFWVSVWLFQRWAAGSKSWTGFIWPLLLYWLATFTYENTTFLIFAIPLLVWPVHVQFRNSVGDLVFLMRTCAGVAAGFVAFVFMRFTVFSGGAVGHKSLLPQVGLIWSYVSNAGWYCLAPFSQVSSDIMAWVWGFFAATVFAVLVFPASKSEPQKQQISGALEQSFLYIAALGVAAFVLGMLPYIMAGYDSTLGFTSQSRVYSSGTFGLAILMAAILSTSSNRFILRLKKGVAIVMIALMAIFLAGLRIDWLEAAKEREELSASLVQQVPSVSKGTTFLFLDLQSYIYDKGIAKAVIFQGVDGLGEWVQMLYNKRGLYAYFLYPQEAVSGDTEGRIAYAGPIGVIARGSAVRPPIPLDSLLIFKRKDNRMVLLDKLSSEEGIAAIDWKGLSEIRSNPELILQPPRADGRLSGGVE